MHAAELMGASSKVDKRFVCMAPHRFCFINQPDYGIKRALTDRPPG